MATQFIDTNEITPVALKENHGKYAEILNNALCGAKNVVASLHWLGAGQDYSAVNDASTHQVLYLMEGDGKIRLDGKNYDVGKGAGVYLGPSEKATISQTGTGTLKLFHLTVPKV